MQAPPSTERVDLRYPNGHPFGDIFAGENHTKLPTPELLRVQAQQLEKARGLGYDQKTKAGQGDDPQAAGAAGGFYGAALLSLERFNYGDTGYGPGTKFYDYVSGRLGDAAAASRDLGEFVHALDPLLTCRRTETGQAPGQGRVSWEIYYAGAIRMYAGPGPIPATVFVDFFISSVEGDWVSAEEEEAYWEDELENDSEGGDAGGGQALGEERVDSDTEML